MDKELDSFLTGACTELDLLKSALLIVFGERNMCFNVIPFLAPADTTAVVADTTTNLLEGITLEHTKNDLIMQDKENDRVEAEWKKRCVEEARLAFLRRFPSGRVISRS